ncbi:MAG TPA: hypothetical protein VNT27_15365 [Propionibacteriaceae bacterium]|nr:hypothetical protein [Propionibacteriaceae bacterium]
MRDSDTTPAWEEKATRRIGDICRLSTHRCLRVEAEGAVRRGAVIDASTERWGSDERPQELKSE